MVSSHVLKTAAGIKGGHRRIHRSAEAHGLLAEQVMYQLQERVLQELELVFGQLVGLERHLQPSRDDYVVRQLADSEVESLRRQSLTDFSEDTLAIITFCADSNVPLEGVLQPMTLLFGAPTTSPLLSHLGEFQDDLLPPHRVPVYNGRRLFPDPSRRTVMRSWLEKLCASPDTTNAKDTVEAAKMETAFIIRNPRQMLERRIDMAPLAVALWRIRLWDGEGWRAPQG